MRHVQTIAIASLFLVPVTAWAQTRLSPPALIKEAEHQRMVLGDTDAALRTYRKVIDHAQATPEQKADARLGLTDILADLGRIDEAREHADWLAANAPDSPQATAAMARLAHLAARDPATLMPAETLIYMELVQPGRQLEQILQMLQDAGLDDTLESMMRNANGAGTRPAGPSPLRMILNPSLLGELKKIEGLAVGISKIDDPTTTADDTEFIGALLPGQSQAVRGMVQMLLTMGSESVETFGNATLHKLKPNGAQRVFAAITPEAILVGRPRTHVTETIAHLNQTPPREPGARSSDVASLADQPRFQRQAGARRQDSVILMYADINRLLTQAKAMMETHKAHELALLNELVDLEAVDDLSVRSRLINDGVAFEMAVSFKPDRPNTFYKLIHTPPADRQLLEYIPADALACALMSLEDGAAKYDELMTFVQKAFDIGQRAEPGKDRKAPSQSMDEIEAALGINLRNDLFANIKSFAAAVTAPAEDVMQMMATGTDPDSAYAFSSLLAIRAKSPDELDQTLTTMANAAARHHLKDAEAEAAITTERINDVPLTRYTIPGADVTPVVARFDDVFVVALYDPFMRKIVNTVRGDTKNLGRAPEVAETLAKLPEQTGKLLIIRPEVVLNATQMMERLKHDDARTETNVAPMSPVRPMVGYTLENGDAMTARLEVHDAAALLAHIMKVHKAENQQHATQLENSPAHSP